MPGCRKDRQGFPEGGFQMEKNALTRKKPCGP